MAGMAHAQTHGEGPPAIGALLQYCRKARNLSQLALAHEANVSPRHACFVETGRAKPSRDMVLLLTDALAVPLREKNAFLLAAGFAPMFRESALDAAELAPVRTAIDATLKQQEPYPAVVMNRRWDIVATNTAAARFFGMLLDGRTPRAQRSWRSCAVDVRADVTAHEVPPLHNVRDSTIGAPQPVGGYFA
jgi:transcriptional regulator with XRE-family HTH domain